MDKETMEKLLTTFKNEIIDKMDSTSERLNAKIEKNITEIAEIKDNVATNTENLKNNIIRAETNTDNLNDLKLRIDKLEREKDLNNQRFGDIEAEMDGERIHTPPKVKVIQKDINKLKEDFISKEDLKSIKQEISMIKNTNKDSNSNESNKINSRTRSSAEEDIFLEERG